LNFCNNSDPGDVIKLPEPKKEGGMPLFEAVNKRQSLRNFNNSIQVTPEIISQALWLCYGINRPPKARTVPSAKGWYNLLVYVFLEEGVFSYNPVNHELVKLFNGDHRDVTGTQKSVVNNARINFVFVANFKKKSAMDGDDAHKLRSIYLDTGHVTMTLSLFASSMNMKGVCRAMVDTEALLDFLRLSKEDYIFTLAYSLGY
jgi:SagB-type dehydrogenase family enzyme